MIHHIDPDASVPEVKQETCPYHQKSPGSVYAGCTCSMSFGSRPATPEERAVLKRNRLLREIAELESTLEQKRIELYGM